MASLESPNNENNDALQQQIEAVFDTSPIAADYTDFLEVIESGEPLSQQDFDAINQQITEAQTPVIDFITNRIHDDTMKSVLKEMTNPEYPQTCSDMAEKLMQAYQLSRPGSPPSAWILQNIAILDTIEEITWNTQPTEEMAPHIDKPGLQSKILVNTDLSADYKQALIAAVDALVPGQGIDLTDPDAFFAAIEKKTKEERSDRRLLKFRRLFDQLGKDYHVEHDPEFQVLKIVTSLAISDNHHEPYIPESDGAVSDMLRLLGIPYDTYTAFVQQTIDTLDT